jgi:hypothetical protein
MRIALLAAVITLTQIALFVNTAPGRSIGERYLTAFQWDSVWYADIARRGYVSTIPPVPNGHLSNVTHFPAYPLGIRGVENALGLSDRMSSLVTAHVCAWGVWMYVLLILKRWRVDGFAGALAVLAIAVHPTAFFLITAYSEALFVMTSFGCWFWYTENGTSALALAAVHGFALTATRISGVAAAGAFVLDAALGQLHGRARQRNLAQGVILTAVSLGGAAIFFTFCAVKFGAWNFYLIRQAVGWGHQPDYLAAFYPSAYRLFIPNWRDEGALGAFENPYVLAAIAVYVVIWVRRRTIPESLALVVMAAIILYVSICGVYHTHFAAMARYQFPIHAMLVIGFVDVLRFRRDAPLWLRVASIAAVLGLSVLSLRVQLDLAAMFARRLPVV